MNKLSKEEIQKREQAIITFSIAYAERISRDSVQSKMTARMRKYEEAEMANIIMYLSNYRRIEADSRPFVSFYEMFLENYNTTKELRSHYPATSMSKGVAETVQQLDARLNILGLFLALF